MKKYVAYIRVSTVKQGQFGSSLQEQRDSILAFAKRFELPIVEWFEDRETAAKKGRSQFLRMMTLLERRKATGVILHKIDRGARNLWDWARLQDLIDAGVEVHFAHDNLDLTSRGGRLAADIQAVVAADYVRNLRDEVRKGIRGRLKQGVYPFRAPIGYCDQGKAKPKTIDPIKGPLVREAFELYATRRFSYHTLAVELHRRGLQNKNGKPLTLHSIMRILRNPFYIGIIRIQRTGEVFQGAHQPLVEAGVFQRVQDIIDGRQNVRWQRHAFTYRRLLTCGLCRRALTGERQKGHIYYRCHTRNCPTTGIREEAVAAVLAGIVNGLPFSGNDLDEMAPYIDDREQDSQKRAAEMIASLQLNVASIEERERRLTDAYLDGGIDRETYHDRRSRLLSELAQARDNLRRAKSGEDSLTDRIGRYFELLETLHLGPESGLSERFREAVRILTSNRSLIGEELSFEPNSPFKEMLCDAEALLGGLSRSGLRTNEHSLIYKTGDPSIAAERLRILSSHLGDWKAASFSISANVRSLRKRNPEGSVKVWKRNPAWFKPGNGGPKSFQRPANDQTDGDIEAAA